jgi:hypothetical protein
MAVRPEKGSRKATAVMTIQHHRFGARVIEVAEFIRSVGATPRDDAIALIAEIDRRWPDLSIHDLHGAVVLAAALALEVRGHA